MEKSKSTMNFLRVITSVFILTTDIASAAHRKRSRHRSSTKGSIRQLKHGRVAYVPKGSAKIISAFSYDYPNPTPFPTEGSKGSSAPFRSKGSLTNIPTYSPSPTLSPTGGSPTNAPTYSHSPSTVPTDICRQARYVKLYTGPERPSIKLFEVMVLTTSGNNVALNGTAIQSTTFNETTTIASNAIDGNNCNYISFFVTTEILLFIHSSHLPFNFTNATATYSLTNDDGYEGHWTLDLVSDYTIESVVVLNHGNCGLSDVHLQILDDYYYVIEERTFVDTCNKEVLIETFEGCPTSEPTFSPTTSEPTTTFSPTTSYPSYSPTIFCNQKAKMVRIRASKTSKPPLHMFEVQAHTSSGTNVALLGTATQSSTFKGNEEKFGASNAIDGDNSKLLILLQFLANPAIILTSCNLQYLSML